METAFIENSCSHYSSIPLAGVQRRGRGDRIHGHRFD